MPQFFRLNAANATIFRFNAVNAVILYGSTPLTPHFFRFKAINAASFPVKRR